VTLRALIELGAAALSRAGVKVWEICASEDLVASVEAMDGEVHAEEHTRDRSIGFRVIDGGVGFAALSEASERAIDRAVEAAIAEARLVRPTKLDSFAGAAGPPPGAPFLDPRATGRPRPLLAESALALESRALRENRSVARVRPASVTEVVSTMLLRTSSGLVLEERQSRAFATIGAVAEGQGDNQMAYASSSAACVEALELEKVAVRAAERAGMRLGAGTFKTAVVPVLLDPEVVAELLEVLLSALAGDAIERGASFLAKGIGAPVVSPAITIVDRPHDRTLDGACWFDGEGLSTADCTLIEAGVVTSILDDLESASRAGRKALGHADRSSALGRPHPGAHGPHLLGGTEPLEALMRAAAGGLYVHELSGTHTINEVTGALSLGASGWRIEGGALGSPVEGVTIAGSLLELLGGQPRLSREVEIHSGTSVPALLLGEVQVASAE
jgi:PmbA protein